MRREMGSCAAGVLLTAGLTISAAVAQGPSPGGALVTFDFLAVEAEGRPIPDLRREELTLKIGGHTREVRSLELIRVSTGAPAAGAIAPPFATNRHDAGRTVLIVFNHDSIRPGKERQAVEGATRFLDSLSRSDRVGLLTMPNGRIAQEVSTDHARVRESLQRITGQASPQASDSDRSCMTRLTLETMTGVLESLTIAPGPKTIAFVSSGLLTPRRDAPLTAPPGMCEIKLEHFQDLGRAASAASAHFYVIQPEDFQVDSGRAAFVDPTASRFRSNDDELTGLSSLAGVTGGEMFRLSAQNVDKVFERIARESSAYYLVAFEPAASERNGSSHRVELAVSRPDATLRVRPHLTIAKPSERRKSSITPQAMLRDFRGYDELPLRLTAYASPNPVDSKVMVTAVAEPIDTTEPITSAAFGLIDPKGRLVAQWTADPRQLESIPIIAAGLAAPGDYRLRAAAIDAAGRRGMVEYELTSRVPTAGDLKMSGVVLGVSRGGRFVPRLQFAADPAAMVYAELYGTPPAGRNVTAKVEVTKSEEGPPIMSLRAHVGPTSDPERRIISGTIAVGALPPADYLVRAIVSVDEQPALVATRTLRKARP